MQKENQPYKIEPASRLSHVSEYYFSRKLKEVVHGRNTENSRKVQTFLYGYDLSEGFLAFYGNFYRVDIEDFINLRDLKIFRHNKSCSQAYCALHAVPAC